jgi:antitoxin YefM
MTTLTAIKAKANLDHLIDQVAESHKPILITSKHSNAVLISEEDWIVIQEMLYQPTFTNK